MPPPQPRAFTSLAYRCSSCASTFPRRAFTSSATRHANPDEADAKPETPTATSQIPPESPRYIDIPAQKQLKATKAPIIKGALPVPRDIFVNRSERPKHSEEFIASATREPAREPITIGDHVLKTKYKAKMAKIRRRSLKAGIEKLHLRKERSDLKWATRGATRQAEQRALLSAPEPLDEQLTKTSVTKAVRDLMNGEHSTKTRSPGEAKRHRRNAALKRKGKAAERNDQLHTLYMHAREFIVTEEQLVSKIDEAFGTEEHPADFYGGGGATFGRSIWAKDAPRSVSQMLGLRTQRAVKDDMTVATRARIHKIAEELTGGKI
ncbi:uncharacterized protein J3D65DRAFT_609680 [Phyllosticta citribraziliensis]|uniref:Uncharacterized protein n=1 Tax=Phyllosticta citribraziliensis TaxID=989973 RepID=A0ABR1M9B7_9PEZI